ncbi:methyltransferase family protein [Salinibacter altiplanensis]|uniref:methyltransferase family protein n=1 Tax=Salinibacter altiplanensis TaxID=1803181 RepID=UPI000C9FFB54|nr:isoprenylcysteine carboxylmethyltransferase family protein [Salinibacter altiplanensis]
MTATGIVFWTTMAVATSLDVLLIATLFVPSVQFWPPPGRRTWQCRLVWTLYSLLLPGVLGLARLNWGTLPLDEWIGHAGHLSTGTGLVAVGTGLALWGVYTLSWPVSLGMEEALVVSGPYWFTRNPQYVGDILLAAGLPVLSGSALLAVVAPGVALGFVLVPFAEEPWLETRYGEAYRRYRARVPRWIPICRRPALVLD